MGTPEMDRVIAGLTAALREAILHHKTTQGWGGRNDRWLPGWSDVGHALKDLGIIDFVGNPLSSHTVLTKRGLAIRARLIEQQDKEPKP